MTRVLDEVAEAIHRARRGYPRPVVSAFGLEQQFGGPLVPWRWIAVQRYLRCSLPPLEFVQGHYFLPDGFTSIWDLAAVAADAHPEWAPPAERTAAAWRNAQVFAGVKVTLVYALNVEPSAVTREARLKRDLGTE